MKDSEKNGGHLLFIHVSPTSVPSSPKPPLHNSFPPGSLDSRWPDLYLSPVLLIPCWVLLLSGDSRSICPFRPQNDRRNILFLMTLLPGEGCGGEMGLKRGDDS